MELYELIRKSRDSDVPRTSGYKTMTCMREGVVVVSVQNMIICNHIQITYEYILILFFI